MKLDVTLTVEEVKDAVVAVLEKDGFPVKQGTADMTISQGRQGNPTTVTISIDTNGVPGSTVEPEPKAEEKKERKPRSNKKEVEKKEVVTQTGSEIMADKPKVEAEVKSTVVDETKEVVASFDEDKATTNVVEEDEVEVEEETNVKMESAPSTSLFD